MSLFILSFCCQHLSPAQPVHRQNGSHAQSGGLEEAEQLAEPRSAALLQSGSVSEADFLALMQQVRCGNVRHRNRLSPVQRISSPPGREQHAHHVRLESPYGTCSNSSLEWSNPCIATSGAWTAEHLQLRSAPTKPSPHSHTAAHVQVLARSRGVPRSYLLPGPAGKRQEEPSFHPQIDPRSKAGPSMEQAACHQPASRAAGLCLRVGPVPLQPRTPWAEPCLGCTAPRTPTNHRTEPACCTWGQRTCICDSREFCLQAEACVTLMVLWRVRGSNGGPGLMSIPGRHHSAIICRATCPCCPG